MNTYRFLLVALGFSTAASGQMNTKTTPSEVYDTVRAETLNEITLTASRPGARVPMPQLRLKPGDLAKQNVGRDVPFLLQGMPCLLYTSPSPRDS